jgi:hypothetical protein
MTNAIKLLFLMISFFLFSCGNRDEVIPEQTVTKNEPITDTIITQTGLNNPTISKGFYGNIWEYIGDFMPGPEAPSGTINPFQGDLYIYNALTFDSIKDARTELYSWFWFVDKVRQKPLFIVKPNEKGFYQIQIEKGNYTGLVKIDDDRFYSNGGPGGGQLGRMLLEEDVLIKRDFKIDYQASH